jgi:hypothetical protein
LTSKIIAILVAAVLWSQVALAASSSGETDAAASSQSWLELIDTKDYGGSWDKASTLFQGGVGKQRWQDMVKSVRERLGDLKSRKFEDATLTKSLPGVPDGDYAIVRFQAVFEKKADAEETITLVREGNAWKAGGYCIR